MTISAKVIADSISEICKTRITTFELEYQRFIHAEFMTHRLFSRNAASSRAIPIATAIKLILSNIAKPIHWGKNQPGMSAKEECTAPIMLPAGELGGDPDAFTREQWWDKACHEAIFYAERFNEAGYHKQIVNRLLEPFTHIKVVVTATDYDNFYWLRDHPDAQPEIQALARQMLRAVNASTPIELKAGEWHTPYFGNGYWKPSDDNKYSLQDALAISASQCAQVSYRKADDSLEKARSIYARLVESEPVHASPFEHQATPINYEKDPVFGFRHNWDEGITHVDRYNNAWSGNFMDWIQYRQLIPNNARNAKRVK